MTPVRLHFVVEGQTEEGFVNKILGPRLAERSVFADAHRVTTGRHHGRTFRGGLVRYEHLARDLSLWMTQDQNPDSWFTTMIDLYRLPSDFPGTQVLPPSSAALARIRHLEAALAEDLRQRLGSIPVCERLIPYIQLHEFEALLFSRPAAFQEAFPGDDALVKGLEAIRSQYQSPEDINDGAATAPSKRILGMASRYQKPVAGLLIAERIGLEAMRGSCPRFDAWVASLLALAEP